MQRVKRLLVERRSEMQLQVFVITKCQFFYTYFFLIWFDVTQVQGYC